MGKTGEAPSAQAPKSFFANATALSSSISPASIKAEQASNTSNETAPDRRPRVSLSTIETRGVASHNTRCLRFSRPTSSAGKRGFCATSARISSAQRCSSRSQGESAPRGDSFRSTIFQQRPGRRRQSLFCGGVHRRQTDRDRPERCCPGLRRRPDLRNLKSAQSHSQIETPTSSWRVRVLPGSVLASPVARSLLWPYPLPPGVASQVWPLPKSLTIPPSHSIPEKRAHRNRAASRISTISVSERPGHQ